MFGRIIIAICWVATVIGCLVGGVILFFSFSSPSAPAQGAGAAMAAACAVIPYVFARAAEALDGKRSRD